MAHILLLEPDPTLADVYAEALRLRHHTVAIATTAQQAIFEADTVKPDLVILELQLAAHSGIEFLYEFRSYVDWQAVPAIIVSHVPEVEFKLSQGLLKRLGVVAYHYKPRTNLQVLLHAVENTVVVAV